MSLAHLNTPRLCLVDRIEKTSVNWDTFSAQTFRADLGYSREQSMEMFTVMNVPTFFLLGEGQYFIYAVIHMFTNFLSLFTLKVVMHLEFAASVVGYIFSFARDLPLSGKLKTQRCLVMITRSCPKCLMKLSNLLILRTGIYLIQLPQSRTNFKNITAALKQKFERGMLTWKTFHLRLKLLHCFQIVVASVPIDPRCDIILSL